MYSEYDFSNLDLIVKKLKSKKCVAIVPTDTVMGIISLNPKLIYQIKSRPLNKKLILFINDINQVKGLNEYEKTIINKYWPGGLTIIKNNISYRIPNLKPLINLIKLTGQIYSSSANISDHQPITNSSQACDEFKNQKVDFITVKGLIKNKSLSSTIIDLDNKKVIRTGKINGELILKKLYNSNKMQQVIYIASDHAGFETKSKIIKALSNKYSFKDFGCDSTTSVDYPIYAFELAKVVAKDKNIGILICGTGFGMNIAANKVKGIRAVVLSNPKIAHLAKEHNNCNVICLSARFTSFKKNLKIINNFLNAKFDENDPNNQRHLKRIKLIDNYKI